MKRPEARALSLTRPEQSFRTLFAQLPIQLSQRASCVWYGQIVWSAEI
ncbi:MAG: hypothetical protein ACI87O_002750 [Planctomycetota bacterium]|jgi:hypothetical protein